MPGSVDRVGNYRIDCVRSRDATGVVYEARHLVLPRRAIVKVRDEKDVQVAAVQLLREACILEALEHPGVVRVYESGLLPDRRPWFAHERVDGATVLDLFAAGPLDPPHASALLRDLAEVLEHAHRRGVVHAGLRPDRIAVTGRTRGFPLCVVDWSDARTHDTSAPPPPLSFPDYAAPELVSADVIDDRADVFALGVIGYQALTGTLPFDGIWLATVADGTTQHVPTEVRCPEAPPELTGLVDQMLAWDRWDRPSSAEAFAELVSLAADLAPTPPRPANVVRIRKPKWTPALPLGDGLPDIVADDVSEDKTK
ncbi:MAG TPA: serine/threonine-protein kinase [Kofleriaceae bacterium]